MDEELAVEEEEKKERNQTDAAVFAVDGYLSFPERNWDTKFIRRTGGFAGLFNYSRRNTPCCLISRSLLLPVYSKLSFLHGVKGYKSAGRKDNIYR